MQSPTSHFVQVVRKDLHFPHEEQTRHLSFVLEEVGQWCRVASSNQLIVDDTAGGRPMCLLPCEVRPFCCDEIAIFFTRSENKFQCCSMSSDVKLHTLRRFTCLKAIYDKTSCTIMYNREFGCALVQNFRQLWPDYMARHDARQITLLGEPWCHHAATIYTAETLCGGR
jgi:hypothetical protein